jgi:hypothetical protein
VRGRPGRTYEARQSQEVRELVVRELEAARDLWLVVRRLPHHRFLCENGAPIREIIEARATHQETDVGTDMPTFLHDTNEELSRTRVNLQ